MSVLTLYTAGASYKNKAAMLAAWNAGKDFSLPGFITDSYCSIRDLDTFINDGYTVIYLEQGAILVNVLDLTK